MDKNLTDTLSNLLELIFKTQLPIFTEAISTYLLFITNNNKETIDTYMPFINQFLSKFNNVTNLHIFNQIMFGNHIPIDILNNLANRNHLFSIYALGYIHLHSEKYRNIDKAKQYLEKASNMGFGCSTYLLINTMTITELKESEEKILKLAVEQSDNIAIFYLATYYYRILEYNQSLKYLYLFDQKMTPWYIIIPRLKTLINVAINDVSHRVWTIIE